MVDTLKALVFSACDQILEVLFTIKPGKKKKEAVGNDRGWPSARTRSVSGRGPVVRGTGSGSESSERRLQSRAGRALLAALPVEIQGTMI